MGASDEDTVYMIGRGGDWGAPRTLAYKHVRGDGHGFIDFLLCGRIFFRIIFALSSWTRLDVDTEVRKQAGCGLATGANGTVEIVLAGGVSPDAAIFDIDAEEFRRPCELEFS